MTTKYDAQFRRVKTANNLEQPNRISMHVI